MKVTKAIEGYLIDCRTRNLSRKTILWYEQKLRFLARWLDEEEDIERLNEVTIAQLRTFILDLQVAQIGRTTVNKDGDMSEVSSVTVRGYVQVIKGFFTWCFNEELIEKSPAARLQRPSTPDYLIPVFTPEHIKLMLADCNLSEPLGFRNYTMILVLLETGIRISELCNLRVQDVHPDYIRVMGKGKKEREIGISASVGKYLWKYINMHRHPHDVNEQRVFMNRYSVPLTPTGVDQVLDDIKDRTGIIGVRVSAHTFRHTFACTYLEQGGEIYKLSRLLGHSSVDVTEEYLKSFNQRAARKDQEKFSAVVAMDVLSKRKRRK
jgi:Site-specific recombinase XerD